MRLLVMLTFVTDWNVLNIIVYVFQHYIKGPEAPGDFKAINVGTNQITLTWKQVDTEKSLFYNVS